MIQNLKTNEVYEAAPGKLIEDIRSAANIELTAKEVMGILIARGNGDFYFEHNGVKYVTWIESPKLT